jgi:hypothetical protein
MMFSTSARRSLLVASSASIVKGTDSSFAVCASSASAGAGRADQQMLPFG